MTHIKNTIDNKVNEFPTKQLDHLHRQWWVAQKYYKWNTIRDACETIQFRVSQDAEWVGAALHPSLDTFMGEVG